MKDFLTTQPGINHDAGMVLQGSRQSAEHQSNEGDAGIVPAECDLRQDGQADDCRPRANDGRSAVSHGEIIKQGDKHRRCPQVMIMTFRGVRRRHRRWQAYITIRGKFVSLGSFATVGEAIMVRDAAAKREYGEGAALNWPDGKPKFTICMSPEGSTYKKRSSKYKRRRRGNRTKVAPGSGSTHTPYDYWEDGPTKADQFTMFHEALRDSVQ